MRSRSLRFSGIPSTSHQQLARVGHRHRHLVELQHVERLAVAVHAPRLHRSLGHRVPPRSARPSGRSGPCCHRPHPVDQAVDRVVEQVGEIRAGEVRQHVVVLRPVGRRRARPASRRSRPPRGRASPAPRGGTARGRRRRARSGAPSAGRRRARAPSSPARRRMRASTATASSSAGWNVPWLVISQHERRVGLHVLAQRPAPGPQLVVPAGALRHRGVPLPQGLLGGQGDELVAVADVGVERHRAGAEHRRPPAPW